MPKPFVIGIEIEEVALGSVLRKLNALPGVVKLHMQFEQPKPNGHARKSFSAHGEPGRDAMLKMIASKPMNSGGLREAFAAQGRSPKSISSIIHHLKKGGLLRSGADGYSITDKGKAHLKKIKTETTGS